MSGSIPVGTVKLADTIRDAWVHDLPGGAEFSADDRANITKAASQVGYAPEEVNALLDDIVSRSGHVAVAQLTKGWGLGSLVESLRTNQPIAARLERLTNVLDVNRHRGCYNLTFEKDRSSCWAWEDRVSQEIAVLRQALQTFAYADLLPRL